MNSIASARVFVLGLGLLGPPVQHPSPPKPIVLDWRAPDSCPAHAELLERLLEHAPTSGGSTLRVHARVELRGLEYVVELGLSSREGESQRSFSAHDCTTLVEAIELVVAVTIDPIAATEWLELRHNPQFSSEPEQPEPGPEEPEPEEPEPEPEPGPEEPEREPTSTIFELEPASPLPSRGRLRVGLQLSGGGGYGPTRTGYAELGGALALLGPRWRWELGGTWSIPRVVRRSEVIRGRFDAWTVDSRGCFVPVVAKRIELPLCAGLAIGQVRGQGLDPIPRVHAARYLWIAPSLAQGLWWTPFERLAIGVDLEVLVPLTRGRFVVDTLEVDRVAAIGVRALAGFELRLPW